MGLTLKQAEEMMNANNGNLVINNSDITSLPDGLEVKGDLVVYETPITKLPSCLIVRGNVNVTCTPLKAIPDDAKICGSEISLYGTEIKELPSSWSWRELQYDLDLRSTDYLEKLPDNFCVNGDLDLNCSNIKKLPCELEIKGHLCLSDTQIRTLPAQLIVGGNLILRGTEISKLPSNLVVGGSLILNDKITEIPVGIKVGGEILDQNYNRIF